jgi:hypothetical protein
MCFLNFIYLCFFFYKATLPENNEIYQNIFMEKLITSCRNSFIIPDYMGRNQDNFKLYFILIQW